MADPIEMVFLSYDEPLADELYKHACHVLGSLVYPMRLHGVRGVSRAYRMTAELIESDWYLLVDGDCRLKPAMVGELQATMRSAKVADPAVFIWRSRNPVNGLEYGYGGPKLVHKRCARSVDPSVPGDPLGQVEPLWFLDAVVCETWFHQSEFHAWRAGMREVMSLRANAFGMDPVERDARILAWTSAGAAVPFSEWSRAGAQYALTADLDLAVGDPTRLARLFDRLYPDENVQ